MTSTHRASAFVAFAVFAALAAPSYAVSPIKQDMERGYLMKEQHRASEALAAFGAVLKKDPGNHAALSELGYLHAGLKQYASAAKYLGAAALQEPANMRLRLDLGYVYQALKKRAQAEAEFKAVAANPGELQAQAQEALKAITAPSPAAEAKQSAIRAKGYAALDRGDRATARKEFEAAVVNDPQDPLALKQLGFMNLADGRLQAAVANFEALRVLVPADLFSTLQLGYTYDRMRKPEQAREAFSAALASTDEKVRDAAQAALKTSVPPSAAGSSL